VVVSCVLEGVVSTCVELVEVGDSTVAEEKVLSFGVGWAVGVVGVVGVEDGSEVGVATVLDGVGVPGVDVGSVGATVVLGMDDGGVEVVGSEVLPFVPAACLFTISTKLLATAATAALSFLNAPLYAFVSSLSTSCRGIVSMLLSSSWNLC